jgi:hypothetical protein
VTRRSAYRLRSIPVHLDATTGFHRGVRFRQAVDERRAAFGLRVAPEKTALSCFDGNLLQGDRRPVTRPATFTFLGFPPLPGQDTQGSGQHRSDTECENTRALRSHGEDLAQGQ